LRSSRETIVKDDRESRRQASQEIIEQIQEIEGCIMATLAQILAGRQAVDEYRAGDTGPGEKGIANYNTLISALSAQGFTSIDDFFQSNSEFVWQDILASEEWIAQCDECVGKPERACEDACYRTWKGVTEFNIGERYDAEGYIGMMQTYVDKHGATGIATTPDVSATEERPIIPGCSIIRKMKKKPALDWLWR